MTLCKMVKWKLLRGFSPIGECFRIIYYYESQLRKGLSPHGSDDIHGQLRWRTEIYFQEEFRGGKFRFRLVDFHHFPSRRISIRSLPMVMPLQKRLEAWSTYVIKVAPSCRKKVLELCQAITRSAVSFAANPNHLHPHSPPHLRICLVLTSLSHSLSGSSITEHKSIQAYLVQHINPEPQTPCPIPMRPGKFQ